MDSKNDLCIADDMSAFSTITLSMDIGDIVINVNNGNVEYPDDLPAAAKKFWTALEEAFQFRNVGGLCKDCKHYSSGVLLVDNGNCSNGIDIRGNGTPRDFGCTLWEATEESCD